MYYCYTDARKIGVGVMLTQKDPMTITKYVIAYIKETKTVWNKIKHLRDRTKR